MKILHITPSYKPAFIYGGPIVSIAQLCESEVSLGHKVTVYCTRANGKEELSFSKNTIANVVVHYYRRWTGDHSHFSPGLLWRTFITARNYEIVHLHSWWNLVSIPLVFLLWCRGVRPILSPRGMLSPYTLQQSRTKKLFQRVIGRWLLSKTILHATSQQELEEALTLVPKWSHFVLPNIIELPSAADYRLAPHSNKVFQLVFLSRIHPKKGLDFLFRVLSQLKFDWTLKLVGTGEPEYIEELKNLGAKQGIKDRIHWEGWQGGEEKYNFVLNADLLVLPSYNENFANVILEALALGTTVMLSDNVGLASYVNNQALGWVLPLEEEQWINALFDAYMNKAKRDIIRNKAPKQIQHDFGAAHLAAAYLMAYQHIISAS